MPICLHWKLSSKWKPRPLRLPWRLFLLLFGLFSQSVDTISTISWSKQLTQSHCLFLLKQMQGRASAVGKMKIELAMTSFIQDGGQKLWFYHQRKLQIFVYFLKVPNGWQDGQKAGTLWETSRIFFFWWSPTKLIQQTTFLIVLVYRNVTLSSSKI